MTPLYPYFNELLSRLKDNNTQLEKSFGKNVHWAIGSVPQAHKVMMKGIIITFL